MRDILDKLETITESTGMANRKPGDIFRNPDGEEIIFQNIQFFPTGGGKLSSEELTAAIKQAEQQLGEIRWQNVNTARAGGFAISTFSGKDGDRYYGRYLETIKPDPVDNFIPNHVGDFRFVGKAAAKAQAGLSPQDLLTNKIDLTANDILYQLAEKLGADSPLYALAYKITQGESLPISFPAPEGISFSAFRDYFCEILQPMALQNGQYTGNAGEAAQIFLNGSFDGTLISFDNTKTAGLSDSIMTNENGKFIKVSTKGGKGATASAKNLIDSINELQVSDVGKKLLDEHQEIVELLREIQRQGQAGAPLYLGVKYGIIDDTEAEKIKDLKNSPLINMENIEDYDLTSNLIELADSRVPDNTERVNLYYHLMAVVAHKAAIMVNNHTNFSKAATDILNNGALVQVYTKAKASSSTWTLEEFNTVYPSDTIKGVYLSASKTYYSTGIKGNFTFRISKGGDNKDDTQDTGYTREKRTVSKKEFTSRAADIALGRERPEIKKEPATGNVGRRKR
jgi:hypothetical protein